MRVAESAGSIHFNLRIHMTTLCRKFAYWFSLPSRWFHRLGFGVQSPWAYEFVTEALYCPYRYYLFDELDGEKSDEQLFRISKWLKAGNVVMHCTSDIAKAYLVGPITKDKSNRSATTIYYYDAAHTDDLSNDINSGIFNEHSCVIIDGLLQSNYHIWIKLSGSDLSTTAFDMGSRGIVFFDPQRQKQIYLT